ncbi:MAG TPA: amino acid permease [Puia sp.]|jgi:amino acid transporter|nr:amino acid permease [Puia sp.]
MPNSLFRKKSLDKMVKDAECGISDGHGGGLKKVLNVKDLTFMGIAAVVGAGIFSTIGTAAFDGGPGISLLFVLTAVTCGFSAMCYAEFASRVPIAGSAYTYAYVSFGEIVAWIIGWALILEYAIGNIVVAISWSGYFNNLLVAFGIHLPHWLITDPGTAKDAFLAATDTLVKHPNLGVEAKAPLLEAINIWNSAPVLFGSHVFMNLPAFCIVCLIAYITYIGIRESKKTTNAMVIFKLSVVVLVIILGAFFVNTANWNPFLPNGVGGVLKGVSAVFYAYIGFDAISTTAEECTDAQRDLPKGMIYSLLICTVLYILIALVLTGMVSYTKLNLSDPLAFVFQAVHQKWIGYFISVSAVVATTSVLLVFQLGQPRIWMSMSRDGLLPKAFGKIHPKFHTPWFSTIITGIIVAVPALFMGSNLMTQLTSIGTLFAFVLVSYGVLVLPKSKRTSGFRMPYVDGRIIVPALYALFIFIMWGRITGTFREFSSKGLHDFFFRPDEEKKIIFSNEALQEVLFIVYIILAGLLTMTTIIRKYSLIPVLGVLFCAYLLIEIPAIAWIWFFVWMTIGLIIYFLYGYRKSRLTTVPPKPAGAAIPQPPVTAES